MRDEDFGMVVFVHNSSFRPSSASEGIFVRPGENTFVGVRRTFRRNAPAPYTDCSDLVDYTSKLFDFIRRSPAQVILFMTELVENVDKVKFSPKVLFVFKEK